MELSTFKDYTSETYAEIVDIDTSKKTVVAYVSKFGNIDYDGDMMMQGCYTKSIQERGIKGTNMLRHLSNHRATPEFVLSKEVSFEEDKFGLKMFSAFRDSPHANDIYKGYEENVWNQHSVMFSVPKGKFEKKSLSDGTEYKAIYEARLFEGSTVVWGANPDTPTVGMKSFFDKMYEGDTEKAFAHLENLIKANRKGTFTDDFFPLLDIQIKQIKSYILEQKSIEPVPTPQPTKPKGEDLIKLFAKI